MAINRFVVFSVVVAIIFVLIASGFSAALAEDAVVLKAEITGFNITPEGIEVEVTDITGNIRAYYDSGSFVIGEPVSITLLGNEIVDVIYINRLAPQRTK